MAEIHATLSPSSADRWMTCPGSVPLSEGIVDTSSDYAAEGSAAHEIAALCLTNSSDAAAYVGRIVEIDTREIEITADMAEHIQVYVDHVRGRVADWINLGATVTLEVEQRVPIGHLTGEDGAEGTADAVIIAELPDVRTAIEVIDLKFGRGVEVEATDNRQLRLYALGAIEKFGMVWTFTEARVAISQPRLSTKPAEWEVSIEDLERFGQDVKRASASVAEARICFANKSPDFDLFLQPSEKGCKWCKVKGTCNALAQHVTTAVLDDFEDLTQAGVEQAIKDVPARSDYNLAAALATVDLIEDWCKAVREEGYSRLFRAGNTPEVIEALGFKLVEGREGARKWTDEAEAEAALKAMRLKQEAMYEFKVISPTKAADLAPSYDKAGKVKPLKEGEPKPVIGDRQWKKLQALITRAPAGLQLVPADHKKAPAKLNTAPPSADDMPDLTEGLDNLEEAGDLA